MRQYTNIYETEQYTKNDEIITNIYEEKRMSDLAESLAGVLADAPERLVLSKQVSKAQEYRKVMIEKRTITTRFPNIPTSRCFMRTATPGVWLTI